MYIYVFITFLTLATIVVGTIGFFIGRLMWKNKCSEDIHRLLKDHMKELEFYENNIKLFHKYEYLQIPVEGLTILTQNAFIEVEGGQAILYPTPLVEKNPCIVLQNVYTDETYLYLYKYEKPYEQNFESPYLDTNGDLIS